MMMMMMIVKKNMLQAHFKTKRGSQGGFGSETKPLKRKVKIKLVIKGLKKKKKHISKKKVE